MTLLYSAKYTNGSNADNKAGLTSAMTKLLMTMTTDNYDDRASLEQVMKKCDEALQDSSAFSVCKKIAAVVKFDTSIIEGKNYCCYSTSLLVVSLIFLL